VEQYLVFLQKSPYHMLLLGLALSSGCMLLWPLVSRSFRQANEIGPIEAVQLINRRDAVVVDVRDSGDYAAGHVGNAKHVPESQFTDRAKELEKYKSRPVIVSCRNGMRASSIVASLRKQGFAEAFALRGGITAWQQAGLPLEK